MLNPASMPIFHLAYLVVGAYLILHNYDLNVKCPHRIMFEPLVPKSGTVWGTVGTFIKGVGLS